MRTLLLMPNVRRQYLFQRAGGLGLRSFLHNWSLDPADLIAADDRQDLAGDVARALRGGEEDVRGGDLLRLRWPLHLRACTELANVGRLLVGRIERGPDRPRGDCVDANPP